MNTGTLAQENSEPMMGLAKLMGMAFSGVDLAPLGERLIERAKTDSSANSLMDLSILLQLRGNRELGLATQSLAIENQQIYSLPVTGSQVKIRLLAIMSAGDLMSNTPLEFLLENSDIGLDIVYITQNLFLPDDLPEHDVLFVAIAQSDQNSSLLKQLDIALASWPRPVLNRPDRIALMSRNEACTLLKSVPGVEMPVTLRIDRQSLEGICRGQLTMTGILEEGGFPVIIRPVDSHAGHNLNKIEDSDELAHYLESMPNCEFYISRFIDYRSRDGLFRKYRIVLIGGRPFACHLGISEHWMIHYLNAGMAESAEKRAEEAQFMADFESHFAYKHSEALRVINERIGLDYLGIDCGETADGKLLIFEVDSCMIVHAIDPVDLFPYKQPQMHKVFSAFRRMLLNTVQSGEL